jgi:hypothetical protein
MSARVLLADTPLKRRTPLSNLIGAVTDAVPPLAGTPC